MSKIKISIIIPVYNVQDYIQACLHSIMNQTIQEGLECILVDDCGNDDSISLAQQLISNYTGQILFRILRHHVNQGLSCARNTGIEAAHGEYIGFVDSDDYIESSMYEDLSRLLDINPKAQFAAAPIYEERENKTSFFNGYEQYQHNSHLTINEFFHMFLTQKIDNASWNKLYRKTFFHTHFKEHRNNEDFLFLYYNCKSLMGTESTVVLTPKPLYHYRIRQGSICQQDVKSVNMLFFDQLENYREILSDLKAFTHLPLITDSLEHQFRSMLFYNFYNVLFNEQLNRKRSEDVKKFWKDIKRVPLSEIPADEKALTKELIFIKYVPFGVKLLSILKTKISRK